MGILSKITRLRAKAHHNASEKQERKTQKLLLARNKAAKQADAKEKEAQAKEELARARERKARAQAVLDKDKKKTDWRKIGRDFFTAIAPAEMRRQRRKVTKKTVSKRPKSRKRVSRG